MSDRTAKGMFCTTLPTIAFTTTAASSIEKFVAQACAISICFSLLRLPVVPELGSTQVPACHLWMLCHSHQYSCKFTKHHASAERALPFLQVYFFLSFCKAPAHTRTLPVRELRRAFQT